MADNLNVTAGTGTVVATDQVGSAHYQKVKLADGTADSAAMIVADTGAKANALRVVLANDYLTPIGGSVAADAADADNPVKVGGKAVAMGASPGTAMTVADRTNLLTDQYGRALVDTSHPNYWSFTAAYGSAQTGVEVKATPGAGLSIYITDVVFSNGATAGTIKLLSSTPADLVSTLFMGVNSTVPMKFATPIKLTADKALQLTSVTVTTHSVTVNGYIAP